MIKHKKTSCIFLLLNLLILTISLFFAPTQLRSQSKKVEVERPIALEKVPISARNAISPFFDNGKIDWIQEKGIDAQSLEAKLKYRGTLLSIEFDSSGIFQDLEMVIDQEELQSTTLKRIREEVSADFDRSKLVKIQAQYLGNLQEILKEICRGEKLPVSEANNYEIVLFGKSEAGMSYYEYLFSASGKVLRKSKIKSSNTDNLLY